MPDNKINTIKAYASQSEGSTPAPWQYEPREPRPDDVTIKIRYCGVCHTDIHFVNNDWGMTEYPVVPGHEIIGEVTAVGPEVGHFRPGDLVGVGCLVDSCRECAPCCAGLEQYCQEGAVFTYNGVDRHDGKITYGGYAEEIIVSDRFVVKNSGKTRSGSCRAYPLRWHYHLLSAQARWCQTGRPGWRDRHGRPGPYGNQVRQSHGCRGYLVHPFRK